MVQGKSKQAFKVRCNFNTMHNKRPETEGKIPVPEPLSVPGFFGMLVIYLCKKFLHHVQVEKRVAIYGVVVVVGSVICDVFPLPHYYITGKGSVFNQWFVKLSWGWTFTLLFTFVTMTSYVYSCGNVECVKQHLSRLIVGTVCWYVCTTLFLYIEKTTGFCSNPEYTDKQTCLKQKRRWFGFDISGHTFLLMYCILIIVEESKCMINWDNIGDMLRKRENKLRMLSDSEIDRLQSSYEKYSVFIKLNLVALSFLCLLWEVMLVITVLYWHSVVQKVMAWLIAAVCWYMTYRVWYKREVSPGMPAANSVIPYQRN